MRHHDGIGDGACAVTENGRLRVATVVARRGDVEITVRYASEVKDAAGVEHGALEAARSVAASP